MRTRTNERSHEAKSAWTRSGWRALVVAVAVLLLTGSTAIAVEPFNGDQSHVIGDDVIDTPLEADQLRDGGGAGPAVQRAAPAQDAGSGGHLPGSVKNVELVGQLNLSNVEDGQISDVGTLGDFAYVGSYATPNCDKGGFYVVDISDPTNPTELGFFPTAPGSYVSEGVQALPIKTKTFKGDVLVINNEICADTGEQIGGFSLFDVSDPSQPVPLVEGAGDTDPGGAVSAANQIHSTFAWQQGKRAFLVIVDDEESTDVDIFDISNPRAPVQIAEVGLADWPGAQNQQSDGIGNFAASFLHDMVVKKVGPNWLMLLSYWDAGYMVLNVNDPANPVFVNDTEFTDPDPLTDISPPEGNAHQAEFSQNNRYILAADEDFSPFRLIADITSGAFDGDRFVATQGDDVPQVDADNPLVGPTVFFGRGCIGDPAAPAPSSDAIAVVERGVCTFTEKAANVSAAGYAGGIVMNQEVVDRCDALVSMAVQGDIPFLFVARSTGFKVLGITGYDPSICPSSANPALPAVGTPGESVNVVAVFDGWGYMHLYDAKTLKELDTFAIPEALDPAFAEGFGDLSIHEVATDPEENLAYVSYYAGGFRVVKFGKNGIKEVGRYIDQNGNNFWGVQIVDSQKGNSQEGNDRRGNNDRLVLASDRDSGLWIFRYTGDDDKGGGR